MRTPIVTIFVVCILVVGLALAFYDYRKNKARPQELGISRTEAEKLKDTRLSGDEQLYKEDYEKAIEEYERAVKISPRDAYLHNDLGAAYYHLGLKSMDTPMEEDEFGFGTEVDLRHLEDADSLDVVEENMENTESGIVTVVVNDEADKEQIAARALTLGYYAHVEEEDTEDGKEFWVTIVKGKTKEAFLKAEQEYSKAIDIKSVRDDTGRKYSSYSTASRNLGTLYFRMGRKKEAIAQWRRALQLEPTDGELRELLGKYESVSTD